MTPRTPHARRRVLGGLATGAAVVLAGCTARALGPATGDPAAGGCPSPLSAERTVCPGDDGPLDVRRSVTRVSLPDWSLAVTVVNRSAGTIGTNPYAWSVFRREGDAWRRVAPEAVVEPWVELSPGDAYRWLLANGDDPAADADQRVVLDLAPGRHAFAVPLEGDGRVAAVAPFEVVG